MITVTTSNGKITLMINQIIHFSNNYLQKEDGNCLIQLHGCYFCAQETYEEVYDLINSALKGENQ